MCMNETVTFYDKAILQYGFFLLPPLSSAFIIVPISGGPVNLELTLKSRKCFMPCFTTCLSYRETG